MPSVKWKNCIYVTLLMLLELIALIADGQQMQDPVSMSSDGWRPIIGHGRQSTHLQSADNYIYSETTALNHQQKRPLGIKNGGNNFNQGNVKVSPISQSSPQKKIATIKQPAVIVAKTKKSTIRGPNGAYSNRNEVFVPPPPRAGVFSFINSAPSDNINTRETPSIGLLGNIFPLNQHNHNSQFDFGNQFPTAGASDLSNSAFLTAKPLRNHNQLAKKFLPPPHLSQSSRQQNQKKDNIKYSIYAVKEGPAIDPNLPFSVRGITQQHTTPVAHLSAQQLILQQQKQQNKKPSSVDVQITKENLKQFTPYPSGTSSPSGLGPPRNSIPFDLVQYDFQAVRQNPTFSQQAQLINPNTLTYEVTEGKWLDTPQQPFLYSVPDSFLQAQKFSHLQNNVRQPGIFQIQKKAPPSSTRKPDLSTPVVDLRVPQLSFLPTPYQPDGTMSPTVPTQSEAATVFSKISNKINLLNKDTDPALYDIKDVSTHYPIIIKVTQVQTEGSTDTRIPFIPPSRKKNQGSNKIIKENHIFNEITTQKEEETSYIHRPTVETTKATILRDPTSARIKKKRLRRPSTTTTTEAPVMEPNQSTAVEHGGQEEAERPRIRGKRPRPPSYKIPEHSEELNENYNSIEKTTSKTRGNYRFRNRDHSSTEPEILKRKRTRPSHFESAVKQLSKSDTNSLLEHPQSSYENYPTQVPVLQETLVNKENNENKNNIYKQQETTDEENSRQQFIEEIRSEENTEKNVETITSAPLSDNTIVANDENLNLRFPENEIDYSTQTSVVVQEDDVHVITTSFTTSTTVTPTTRKMNRIRNRPNKYDASHRPRFSVKDYRNKLNIHTSTTPSTTTQELERPNQDNFRLRYPITRLRSRLSPISTTPISRIDEDTTDDNDTDSTSTTLRSKFKPKDPRFQTSTEHELIITDNSVKSVNTRLRPFGRQRTTTESSIASTKVSVRPNLFSAKRRTDYPGLNLRIKNRKKLNETKLEKEEENIETTTAIPEIIQGTNVVQEAQNVESKKISTPSELVIDSSSFSTGTTTELLVSSIEPTTIESTEFITTTQSATAATIEEFMKSDDAYSQRVADLTVAFKDYDKPGIFNSISPTSRSIPNHFTLLTEDPVLPIERVFSNLKQSSSNSEQR